MNWNMSNWENYRYVWYLTKPNNRTLLVHKIIELFEYELSERNIILESVEWYCLINS